MINNPKAKEFWMKYLESIGEDLNTTNKTAIAWYFCDNQESAVKLAELVKAGTKKATASLYYWYNLAKEPLPKEGEYSVITDYTGEPQCIIKTTKITIVPFKEVTEDFARAEGEGDKSLEQWKEIHVRYFSKELKEIGKEFSKDMEVLCEEFELIYKE
ncbi:ASCH domain-containing protein [Clostridium sp.]|uniref:ASCH domain-containing protein n=1 Tax=Clostridium sp. TaxID=1506 RepID=UPI002FCA66E5